MKEQGDANVFGHLPHICINEPCSDSTKRRDPNRAPRLPALPQIANTSGPFDTNPPMSCQTQHKAAVTHRTSTVLQPLPVNQGEKSRHNEDGFKWENVAEFSDFLRPEREPYDLEWMDLRSLVKGVVNQRMEDHTSWEQNHPELGEHCSTPLKECAFKSGDNLLTKRQGEKHASNLLALEQEVVVLQDLACGDYEGKEEQNKRCEQEPKLSSPLHFQMEQQNIQPLSDETSDVFKVGRICETVHLNDGEQGHYHLSPLKDNVLCQRRVDRSELEALKNQLEDQTHQKDNEHHLTNTIMVEKDNTIFQDREEVTTSLKRSSDEIALEHCDHLQIEGKSPIDRAEEEQQLLQSTVLANRIKPCKQLTQWGTYGSDALGEQLETEVADVQRETAQTQRRPLEELKDSRNNKELTLITEIQREKGKSSIIQQKFQKMKGLLNAVTIRCMTAEEENTLLPKRVEREMNAHAARKQEHLKMMNLLMAKRDAPSKHMQEWMVEEKQGSVQREETPGRQRGDGTEIQRGDQLNMSAGHQSDVHEDVAHGCETVKELNHHGQTSHQEVHPQRVGQNEKQFVIPYRIPAGDEQRFESQMPELRSSCVLMEDSSFSRRLDEECLIGNWKSLMTEFSMEGEESLPPGTRLKDVVLEPCILKDEITSCGDGPQEDCQIQLGESDCLGQQMEKQIPVNKKSQIKPFEKHMEAQLCSELCFATELQVEQDNNMLAQDLEKRVSENSFDLKTIKEHASILQQNFEPESKTQINDADDGRLHSLKAETHGLGDQPILMRKPSCSLPGGPRETLKKSPGNLMTQLQIEKDRNTILRQELDKMMVLQDRNNNLQQRVELEIRSHTNRLNQDKQLIQTLTDEWSSLCLQMEEEMAMVRSDAVLKIECLCRQVEELRESNVAVMSELQMEKHKNAMLTQEVEQMMVSHDAVSFMCEKAEEKVKHLLHRIKMETKAHVEKEKEIHWLLQTLRMERGALHQKDKSLEEKPSFLKTETENILAIQENFMALVQAEEERDSVLSRELTKTVVSHKEVSSRFAHLREKNTHFRKKLLLDIKSHVDRIQRDLSLFQTLRDVRKCLCQNMEEQMAALQTDAAAEQDCLCKQSDEQEERQADSQVGLMTELLEEKNKNSVLKREMKKLMVLHREVSVRCATAEGRNTRLRRRLEMEFKFNTKRLHEVLQLLRKEEDCLCRRIEDSVTTLQRDAAITLDEDPNYVGFQLAEG